MKLVKAYIRPKRLQDAHHALKAAGHCCMTIVDDCEGTGNYSDPEKGMPSLKHPFLHNKISKIEIATTDENVPDIIRIIRETASTGEKGDGLILVSPVEEAVKVRTGEPAIDFLK